jgi:hypothetical protein
MKKTHNASSVSKTRSLTRQLFLPVALIAGGLATASTAQAALVFQMDFNDADGNQSLTDRGTTGVTGAFNGTATYSTDVASVNGGGYSASFSGTNGDNANFGDIAALDGLSAFTMTAWVKSSDIDGPSGSARIVSKRQGADGFELYYHSNDNELEFVADGVAANGGGSFTANSWTWIAVTYDGSTANFYTGDGTTLSAGDSADLAKGALSVNSANLLIGNYRTGERPYSGLIDNLRIYNSVEDTTSLTSIMTFDDAAVVPEPGTSALLGGLLALGHVMVRRRRR